MTNDHIPNIDSELIDLPSPDKLAIEQKSTH
ncbi:TPA: arsenical resistance protein ArsH, partial [Pseudomonas aeruginosa]|nr:arsenical resistance protein ArsH [Pseudomonas aeruginosa]